MKRDSVVSRYAIPIGILHIDGWSTRPLGFGASQDGLWFPSQKICERRSSRSSIILVLCASRWQEDVSRSTSPILLEWDEETRRRFRSTMSHVSTGKG